MSVYRFNLEDPEIKYGLIIEKGIDSQLLMMPELKDNGLSVDWVEEHGVERFSGFQRYKSKMYTIQCVIIGDTEQDMLQKYNALEAFLTGPAFMLDDVSKNRRWEVLYNKMTSITKQGRWIRFTIELIDDFPTLKKAIE